MKNKIDIIDWVTRPRFKTFLAREIENTKFIIIILLTGFSCLLPLRSMITFLFISVLGVIYYSEKPQRRKNGN